jgi:hypothetical protein
MGQTTEAKAMYTKAIERIACDTFLPHIFSATETDIESTIDARKPVDELVISIFFAIVRDKSSPYQQHEKSWTEDSVHSPLGCQVEA